MTARTIQLTVEQVELAKMTVEADRAAGRRPDPLMARIASIKHEPLVLSAKDLDATDEVTAMQHQTVQHLAR